MERKILGMKRSKIVLNVQKGGLITDHKILEKLKECEKIMAEAIRFSIFNSKLP